MSIFQTISLMLVCYFYLAFFVKQLMLARKGIKTNRLCKGKKDKETMNIEKYLKAFTLFLVLIQLLSILLYDNSVILSSKNIRCIGLIIAFIGNIFFTLAIITMKESWRAGVDETQETEIITNGIYKISRNPAFVGFDLLYIGMILVFSNIPHIVIAIITIILLHLQIIQEEKFLIGKFKDKYVEYKRKTRRYL